ncbi:MAG: hypothetical protein II710_06555 [Clostridia bacterium]|nr:hypothetical protein [Clostridia bacterium]
MFKRWISAILAVLMIAALLASCGIAVPEETTGSDETGSADTEGETGTETEWETDMKKRYRPEPIDLKTLTQTGSRSQRWLSVPGSRIVLNP